MTSTIEHDGAAALGAESLREEWRERVAADVALGEIAGTLLAAGDETTGAVLASIAARSHDGADEAHERGADAALAMGRAVFAARLDLPCLQRLFGHLQDIVAGRLIRQASDADGQLSAAQAERATGRVRGAMERAVVEATRGWFDEAGRKLRHDVKTPLQATSLNLELLTLETAERGLDTEPLDTIQRSLDQVVEMLARAEPGGR